MPLAPQSPHYHPHSSTIKVERVIPVSWAENQDGRFHRIHKAMSSSSLTPIECTLGRWAYSNHE